MADYAYDQNDGKTHTRYSELVRCTAASIDRVLAERLDGANRVETENMLEGTIRHDMFKEESQRTSKVAACFGLNWPASHIEHEFATEILPSVIVHSRPDVVCVNKNAVVDYKGLALDTPIPTPYGWTTMDKIDVGDKLIGGDGKPCKVTVKSSIHLEPCYKITFDDSSTIVADHEHRWLVDTDKGEKIFTTEQLKINLRSDAHHKYQRHLRIPTYSLKLPGAFLPIDPYVLGAWLGDGNQWSGAITKPLESLFDEIKNRGYEVAKVKNPKNDYRTIYGLKPKLRKVGLIRNKHIPDVYLRASYSQRLDLLKGIMDTDGHWNKKRKRCILTTINESFASQFAELVSSLGWIPHIFEVNVKGFGLTKRGYQVWFTPYDERAFLAREVDGYRIEGTTQCRRRLIKSVEPIMKVPTVCIQVDSIDSTFLCGKQMVRTHNTVLDGTRGWRETVKQYRHTSKQRQLQFYAFQLGLHGILIREGIFLCEIWNKERDTILGYETIRFPITLGDMAAALAWARPRIALLVSALEQRQKLLV